ncbi:MAG TPA: hypothetical protein VNR63_03925 [Gaiellaceae bacterium]|nr:hypothetical protein [Gaiellaceae bacterium]
MLDEKLLDASVAVLPRRVDCAEAAALGQVRIGAVVERELDELVPRRLVLSLARGRSMDRRRLNVLVPRELVRVGAAFEQQPGRIQVTEERREPDRVEAVDALRTHE